MEAINNKYSQLLLTVFLLLIGFNARCQQDAMFTQYMFNGLAINPAYAGVHQTMEFTALARDQWTGLEGAPSTQTFSVHSPLKNRSIGVGLMIINDRIGVTNQYGAYGSYSYRIQFDNRGVLSMGLQVGFSGYQEEVSKLISSIKHQTDPNFNSGDGRKFMPNLGAGLYYYTKKYYLGFSSPHLIRNKYDSQEVADVESHQERHYFLNTGYIFDLNRDLKLKPNLLIKAVEGAPVEADINLSLLIQEMIWLGVSYRSFDSFDALIQLNINEQLSLGYAYDFATTTDLRSVHSGSHEIMINYRLKAPRHRMMTPRYF